MGLMDIIKSAVGGGAKKNDLMSVVMDLIGNKEGGLNGLISQFSSKGLGDVVSSWVAKGKNLPVSASQIKNVLGDDAIKNIASKQGISENKVTTELSNLLPNVVDKLTPDGTVPEGDLLSKGLSMVSGMFGKK